MNQFLRYNELIEKKGTTLFHPGNDDAIKGTGYKDEKAANDTIKIIDKLKKTDHRHAMAIATTMMNRAKTHKYSTPDMKKAASIFDKWIQGNRKTEESTFFSFSEFIVEAKQVGVIYHYTTFENGLKILQSNELKSSDAADSTNANPVYAVSFTRDKRFHDNHTVGFDIGSFGQTPQVRFTVDGDKLSNRYTIGPFAQGGKEGGVFSKGKKSFEAEERVISNKLFSIPIIPYIKSVDILIEYKKPDRNSDWMEEIDYDLYAHISADLIEFTQQKRIPINLIVNKNGDPWPDKAKKTIIQKILDWIKL